MRASRLLSILMLLQSRGRMSAQALAEAARGVGAHRLPRHRPAQRRRRAGVGRARAQRRLPAAARAGARELTGLTAPEAQALFLAGLPGPAAAARPRRGDGVGAAQAAGRAARATGRTTRSASARASTSIRSTGFAAPPPPITCRRSRTRSGTSGGCAMRYESWNGVVERDVEPLGLVLKAGVWYMAAARRRRRRAAHLPAVEHPRAARSLDERFGGRSDFDLAAYWQASTQRFEAGLYRDIAVLRARRAGWKLLRGLSPRVAEAGSNAPAAPDDTAGAQSRCRSNRSIMRPARCCGSAPRSRCSSRRRCASAWRRRAGDARAVRDDKNLRCHVA